MSTVLQNTLHGQLLEDIHTVQAFSFVLFGL